MLNRAILRAHARVIVLALALAGALRVAKADRNWPEVSRQTKVIE